MSEFNNRINAQRDALKVINSKDLYDEPLLSLTEKAINRWVENNGIDNKEFFVVLLKDISGSLFFLANKSQEQITDDYKVLSKKVTGMIVELEGVVANK